MTNCKQIIGQYEALLTVKGSKFLAYAEAVCSVTEAERAVYAVRQAHPKANHHCYAYRLGAEGEYYRVNDDGEPSATAGLPIYQQLRSFSAGNTLVTVVRYFGGTLLGASGLIKAYKQAAKQVLTPARWQTIVLQNTLKVECDYAEVSMVMQTATRYGFTVAEQTIDLRCCFCLQGAEDNVLNLQNDLRQKGIMAQCI